MNIDNSKLPKDYFDMVKEALNEEKSEKTSNLKRKRSKKSPSKTPNVKPITAPLIKRRSTRIKNKNTLTSNHTPVVIINSDDDSQDPNQTHFRNNLTHNTTVDIKDKEEQVSSGEEDSDESFGSDNFEDVLLGDANDNGESSVDNINITLDKSFPVDQRDKSKKQRNLNLVQKEERQFRLGFHQMHLLTLLSHGYQRNKWLNNKKLQTKLNNIIPNSVFDLLHPEKDEEMPLRSTRKLLDGLTKCIKIWDKYYEVVDSNTTGRIKTYGLYMRPWDKISFGLDGACDIQHCRFSFNETDFVQKLTKFRKGNRDLGAQGFVAMLRAVGVNARLVMSLQPPDFTNLKKISATQEKGKQEENSHSSTNTDKQNEKIFEDNLLAFQPGIDNSSTIKFPFKNNFASKMSTIDDILAELNESEKFPIFWCEVWNKFNKTWITVDPINFKIIEQHRFNSNGKSKLEPITKKQQKYNMLRYVIGFDRKLGCKDITPRYTTQFFAKVFKKRCTRIPELETWYTKSIKYLNHLAGRTPIKIDKYEEQYLDNKLSLEGIPDSLQDFQGHPKFVLETNIGQDEALKPGCSNCGFFRLKNKNKSIKVYLRDDLLKLRSPRGWFMEGRTLKKGAKYSKVVHKKSFTTREIEDERLYSIDQTELYVPPLASSNGEIQTNSYGNIDVYKPTMIPLNCVLIEHGLATKAARFLNIPFAGAVTSFTFEKGRTVKPSITGIVVLRDYKEAVCEMIDGISYSQEREEYEEKQLEELDHWLSFLRKIQIRNRLNRHHGIVDQDSEEDIKQISDAESEEGEMVGGFIPENLSDHESVMDVTEEDRVTSNTNSSDQELNEYDAFLNELNDE
ncbi:related to DNA repair protein RAD4 [Saccharomycodes ludwigii]|uniref:Related to DNA repair protein RAD4 n=1 Tax=Saccharomycodes ludwigii TaxID=36035 RepID=A0A376B545_9ASCO|nr:related to DNA repair protein RAD4 [Saccharomycodes ludwigii]